MRNISIPVVSQVCLSIHPTNKKSGQVKEKASIYELATFLIRRVYNRTIYGDTIASKNSIPNA